MTLQFVTLQFVTLRFVTLQFVTYTILDITIRDITIRDVTVRDITIHDITVRDLQFVTVPFCKSMIMSRIVCIPFHKFDLINTVSILYIRILIKYFLLTDEMAEKRIKK